MAARRQLLAWAVPRPGSSHICRSCANEQREIHRAASAALEVRPLTRSAGDALPSPRRVREVFRKTEAERLARPGSQHAPSRRRAVRPAEDLGLHNASPGRNRPDLSRCGRQDNRFVDSFRRFRRCRSHCHGRVLMELAECIPATTRALIKTAEHYMPVKLSTYSNFSVTVARV